MRRALSVVAARVDALLTTERVRTYPLILLVTGLIALVGNGVLRAMAPDIAGPVLPDFLASWTGGRMVVSGATSDLYDLTAQHAVQVTAIGPYAGASWFVAPPAVAVALTPLALLPYLPAAGLWAAVSAALLWFGLLRLGPWAPGLFARHRARVIVVVLASEPVFEMVGAGQSTSVTLVLYLLGITYLLGGRDVLGGAILGAALFKPHLVILVPIVLLAQRRWRALLGFSGSGVVLTLVSLLAGGPPTLRDWFSVLLGGDFGRLVQTDQSWKALGLPSVVAGVLPASASGAGTLVTLGVSLVLVGAFSVWVGRTARRLDDRTVWAVALAATVAVSPHAMIYDGLLLVPAALCLLNEHWGPAARVTTAAVFVGLWLAIPTHALASAVHASVLDVPWVAVLIGAAVAAVMLRLWRTAADGVTSGAAPGPVRDAAGTPPAHESAERADRHHRLAGRTDVP